MYILQIINSASRHICNRSIYLPMKLNTRLFLAALFVLAKTWTLCQYPRTVEWIINHSVVINGILYGIENKGNTAHMTPSMSLTSNEYVMQDYIYIIKGVTSQNSGVSKSWRRLRDVHFHIQAEVETWEGSQGFQQCSITLHTCWLSVGQLCEQPLICLLNICAFFLFAKYTSILKVLKAEYVYFFFFPF